jgi:endonuclease/exonuclease/phosphatase family metal-dependent hydrolase
VSRHPITTWENIDVSHHRLESRGLLHCEIVIEGWKEPLHCINVHLGLWARSRRFQLEWLCERIRAAVPQSGPLVVAGDFNDWTKKASRFLAAELGLYEVFERAEGRPARSYPARMPLLTLDRIYVRDLHVAGVERHAGSPWSRLSDHVALAARLTR